MSDAITAAIKASIAEAAPDDVETDDGTAVTSDEADGAESDDAATGADDDAVESADGDGAADEAGAATGDDADAGAEPGEGDEEAAGGDDAEAEEQPPAKEAKQTKDDATARFEKETGIPARDKRGRENRIPHSRVVQINANAVKKAQAQWNTDVLAPVQAKVTAYEARLDKIAQVEHTLFKEPAAFLDKLVQIPGYAELLQQRFGSGGGKSAGAVDSAAKDFELPQPANGEGYTLQELGTILKSFGESVRTSTLAAMKADVDKTYGGVKKAHDTAAESAELQQRQADYVSGMLNEASKWEGFEENQKEILKAVQADTRPINGWRDFDRILGDAYRKVVLGKQKTTKAAVKQQLKNAPRATSTSKSAVAGGKKGPVSTGDPIRDAIVNNLPVDR